MISRVETSMYEKNQPMKISIPVVCNRSTLFAVLGQVFDEDGKCYTDQYVFDARKVTEIDPVGLVLLNNLFAWLVQHGYTVRVYPPEGPGHSLLRYIHEEGVFPFNDAMNVHREMIPLSHISEERSSSWVLTVFHRWLAEVLGVSTLSLYTHLQFLRLLFRYAILHGEAEGIILHASLERSEDLHIIVAHYGRGIPDLTRNSWSSVANHAIDIAKATEHERTSFEKSPSLMFLIDDVIIENGGRVSIYSGFGQLDAQRNSFGITQKLALCNAFVPGVLFDITFRLAETGLMSRVNEPKCGLNVESGT